jgi:hypothetical protein
MGILPDYFVMVCLDHILDSRFSVSIVPTLVQNHFETPQKLVFLQLGLPRHERFDRGNRPPI